MLSQWWAKSMANGNVVIVDMSLMPPMSNITLRPNNCPPRICILVLIVKNCSRTEKPWTTTCIDITRMLAKVTICTSLYSILESCESMMTNLGGGKWQCLICGLQSKSTNVRYHIEAKHLQPTQSYSCQYCDEVLSNRKALSNHMYRLHKTQWFLMYIYFIFLQSW